MRRLAQIALALGALTAVAGVVVAALFYALILRDLPEIYSLRDYRPNLITRVLARDGQQIATFARERRIVVPIEEIPEHLVHAFIASEDAAFYDHEGLDYAGILRAAIANLRAGAIRQGGSTITQQVAKTFLLSSERSWIRKLKDMLLARQIEQSLEKNEILFLYLNQIYLGSGSYGVEAAARNYFGRSVWQLTLAESALIAGLVPAPSKYTPRHRPDLARDRQRFVLRQMLENEFITEETHDLALDEELVYRIPEPDELSPATAYFTEEVRRYLTERYGSDVVLTGGLTVRTTLAVDAQLAAYSSVRRGLQGHDHRRGYRGPIRMVPEPEWPEVLAEIAEQRAEGDEELGDIVQGLVTLVDAEAQELRIALGPDRETQLTLEDVAWAREPDIEKDGAIQWVRSVSQALKRGYLVRLERTGERTPEGADPNDAPLPTYALFQEPLAEGALFSMEVETGYVLAMTGGYGFDRSQFNRAIQMRRQPGSAFKPVVYATALMLGYTPASIVYDTPIVYEDNETGRTWKPENYSEKFYGPITLRQALARSRNVATIKVLREIGLAPVLEMAEALGIGASLEPNLSLALGSSEVTLAELVRAYATFAAGGRRITPVFILEVLDRDDQLLEGEVALLDRQPAEASDGEPEVPPSWEQIIDEIRESVDREDDPDALPPGYGLDPVTAYLMTDMLRAVVQEGTGFRVRALKRPMAGKTGTTNELNDAWFIGFSPSIVAGSWVGYDSARNLGKNETGSRAASPIFVDYMREVLKDTRPEEFAIPEEVEFARIDRKTGLRAAAGDSAALFQPFRAGTAPLEFSRTTGPNGRPERAARLD